MSRVFLAREDALKRDVVVKVLPPDLVSTASVARFKSSTTVTHGAAIAWPSEPASHVVPR